MAKARQAPPDNIQMEAISTGPYNSFEVAVERLKGNLEAARVFRQKYVYVVPNRGGTEYLWVSSNHYLTQAVLTQFVEAYLES